MAATLSLRPDRLSSGSPFPGPPVRRLDRAPIGKPFVTEPWRGAAPLQTRRFWRHAQPPTRTVAPVQAGSRADDSSAPFEMSVESALKLLGVSEGASFDDILRAKNSIIASCKDDHETIKQVLFFFDYSFFDLFLDNSKL